MDEVVKMAENLPKNIGDLSKFVLVGREKLVAVRAEIRAIDKVGLAKEVREQKLQEAQKIADVVLDAEVRIGELINAIPKENNNQYTKMQPPTAGTEQKVTAKMQEIMNAGISPKQAERFKVIAKHKDIVEKAKAEAKSNDDIVSRSLVLNMIKQEQKEQKKEEIKERIADYAKVQTGTVDINTTDRKYNIIYADPPWQYWENGNKNQSNHYATMTIDEICSLPIERITNDNCVLFIWVTYPILQEAFKVIEAWGFKYSTCGFCWVKKNRQADTPFFGCGAWTRANSELCLIATKGTITRLDNTISQVVEMPIEEHSKKPDIVRELITRLVGELPRIELFCRNKIDGWDVWGNEA